MERDTPPHVAMDMSVSNAGTTTVQNGKVLRCLISTPATMLRDMAATDFINNS